MSFYLELCQRFSSALRAYLFSDIFVLTFSQWRVSQRAIRLHRAFLQASRTNIHYLKNKEIKKLFKWLVIFCGNDFI